MVDVKYNSITANNATALEKEPDKVDQESLWASIEPKRYQVRAIGRVTIILVFLLAALVIFLSFWAFLF